MEKLSDFSRAVQIWRESRSSLNGMKVKVLSEERTKDSLKMFWMLWILLQVKISI